MEVASVSLVRNCLDQFQFASDLSLNLDKSSMLLCGVDPNTKLQLLGALSYREGKLLVRYLGELLLQMMRINPTTYVIMPTTH